MKKPIFELGIDSEKREFYINDHFKDFPLSEMNAIIGCISTLLHNFMHIQGQLQNEYNEKISKQN